MSIESPQVSVVLPAYDRLQYLSAAVSSVFAQTHADWELLIADDGSGAETAAYLEALDDPRVRLLRLPHSGNPGAVRNRGIERARARYVAFLDSDDVWAPRKLEVQLRLLGDRRDRRWSHTNFTVTDASCRPIANRHMRGWAPWDGRVIEGLLRCEIFMATPTVMVERELLVAAGGFDESLRYAEDHDLWIRLSMLSEVSVAPEPLAFVRRHDQHYCRDPRLAESSWMQLYRKVAASVPDVRLQAICEREYRRRSLMLAGHHADRGDRAAFLRAVLDAGPRPWTHLDWWVGAARSTVRAMIPRPLRLRVRDALRRERPPLRRRSRRASARAPRS